MDAALSLRADRRPRAAVVYNPTKPGLASLRSAVRRGQLTHGWQDTLWYATTPDDDGAWQAIAAVVAGADVVIAAGGDGTVRSVAEGLRATRVPLTIVPMGTSDQLARNLGLAPAGIATAVLGAFDGTDRPIDALDFEIRRPDGTVDHQLALVMAGIGLDARMFVHTHPRLKARIGYGAYFVGLARALRHTRRTELNYSIDGGPARRVPDATALFVANCGELRGGIIMTPDASPSDGLLDAAVFAPRKRSDWLRAGRTVLWGNKLLRRARARAAAASSAEPTETAEPLTDPNSGLDFVRGAQLDVELTREEPIQLDGDSFGWTNGFSCSVDPGALLIRSSVPAELTPERAEQKAEKVLEHAGLPAHPGRPADH